MPFSPCTSAAKHKREIILHQLIKLRKSCEVVAFISAVNRGGLNGDPMHLSSEGLRDREGAEGGGTQKMRRDGGQRGIFARREESCSSYAHIILGGIC